MNESRKSKRRRKATRSGAMVVRARRLSIEAMEGRVLLSGNTLDLATFASDLTAASYGPSVVPSFDSYGAERPSHRYEVDDDRPVYNRERRRIGGLLLDPITRSNNINVSVVYTDLLDGSADSNLGVPGGQIHVGGGPEPRVVLSYDGGVQSPELWTVISFLATTHRADSFSRSAAGRLHRCRASRSLGRRLWLLKGADTLWRVYAPSLRGRRWRRIHRLISRRRGGTACSASGSGKATWKPRGQRHPLSSTGNGLGRSPWNRLLLPAR